jgi:hypothetical protein
MGNEKNKHSPAPWTSDEQGLIYAEGDTIALVYDNPDRGDEAIGDEPSEYNKKLICAAPDLLAACEVGLKALSCARSSHDDDAPVPNCDCYACEAANALQSAIRKVDA